MPPRTRASAAAFERLFALQAIMTNRAMAYAIVRRYLFGGRMSQSQVADIDCLFRAWGQVHTCDRYHLAYALATSCHETGRRM